ncbi:hypothetical protein CQA62_06425 [Helicobacter cholecystus]|uniref:Flagellar protein FlgN n=1 Tax=Helicobacter cholecystus TaxID=45498 RepID=A0A3D8IT48_9HELI|nr:hypothetical protein [Helicobacter cholecystus]RDU68203.1 hypothetical protein CQA62_06425 [Helicobacter cholecystus]VEJ26095.1 Uncharacterised protein [Helicobacter cholecystus]
MLHQYLKDAILELKKLIELTHKDINDLSEAKNEEIFNRLPTKENFIKAFEQKKSMIDRCMVDLRDTNPNQPLSDLLDQEALNLLEELKLSLKELKELNSGYARSVYAVNEFYTSLLRKIIPHENSGYGGDAKPQQSFLTIQV